VTKFNAAGSALVYSTYLGGSGDDNFVGLHNSYYGRIAVDSSGNAYVLGSTQSDNFPTTAGAFRTTRPGGDDLFVTKISGVALAPSNAAKEYSYAGGRLVVSEERAVP